ncbi:MAG: hypothetical protein ACXIU7_05360 [Roseinatronobacter sp.]
MTFGIDFLLILLLMTSGVFLIRVSKKMRRLMSLDSELGKAIAVMSDQVNTMSALITEKSNEIRDSEARLNKLLLKAEEQRASLTSRPLNEQEIFFRNKKITNETSTRQNHDFEDFEANSRKSDLIVKDESCRIRRVRDKKRN